MCAAEQHVALGGEGPSSATARTDVEGAVLARQTTPAKTNATGAYFYVESWKKQIQRKREWKSGCQGWEGEAGRRL